MYHLYFPYQHVVDLDVLVLVWMPPCFRSLEALFRLVSQDYVKTKRISFIIHISFDSMKRV